jgi:hypothetical protein
MSPIRPVLRFSIRLKKWEAFIKDVYPIVLNVSSSFCSIDSPPAARATPSPLSSQRWHSSNSFGFHLQQNNNQTDFSSSTTKDRRLSITWFFTDEIEPE